MKISFTNVFGGLIAKDDKYGFVKGFSIAATDKIFVWAKAEIIGNKIVVYSDTVTDPLFRVLCTGR